MLKHPRSQSLSDAVYVPESIRTLLDCVPESHTQIIAEACAVLVQAGYQSEVESALAEITKPEPKFKAAASSTALSGDVNLILHQKEITDQEKWSLSLHAWAQCVEHGPKAAFRVVPFLLWFDSKFFFNQNWIADLIADYHNKNDKESVKRLLFGKGKRGVSDFKRTADRFQRDLKVADHVEYLVRDKQDHSLREAFRAVRPFEVSDTNARARYYKHKEGNDPLVPLLSDN